MTNLQRLWRPILSRCCGRRSPLILVTTPVSPYSSYTNSKERKRFYTDVTVTEATTGTNNGKQFEINLDKRKLKTPGGALFRCDSELLAHMVAQEWRSQLTHIKLNTMHLTSLMNTCLDNPAKVTADSLVHNMNEYLETDTLLFFDASGQEKLDRAQEASWRPLVDWFNANFEGMDLKIKKTIMTANESFIDFEPTVLNKSTSFNKYLDRNFTLNTLIAFNYMIECLKSVILGVALLERRISSVDECLNLTLLEHSHQYEQWGKVEWYHDINEQEMRARVSAALLFIYLSNGSKFLVSRNIKTLDRQSLSSTFPYP